MSEHVQHEDREGPVAVLTLDQPDGKANALNSAMWAALEAQIDAAAGRPGLRGLIIQSGKPNIFIAGADLKELYAGMTGDADAVRGLMEAGSRTLAKLAELACPTVALIDGACLGGGFEVALACDVRLAGTSERCQVGLPEAKLGLIPGWGGTQRLPRLVGLGPAMRMILGGESVQAEEALRLGIVAEVVPSESLLDRAVALLNMPAAVHAVRVMKQGLAGSLGEGLAAELGAFLELTATPEAAARIDAFLNRKKG